MTAARLPYPALVEVFAGGVESSPRGGHFVVWDSHESIKYMPLVCRSWEAPARSILYRSVAIVGEVAADRFLRTIAADPGLAAICRSLVIGVGEDEEDDNPIDTGQRRTSLKLVQVLNACPNVEHLQIRPLHESVRNELIASVRTKPLVSLVCTPRLGRIDVGWTRELFRPHDIVALALPMLRRLGMDVWAATPVPVIPPPASTFGPLSLVSLRLFCAIPNALLVLLLGATSTLEVVDLYLETILQPTELVNALLPSASSLRNLQLLVNPPLEDIANFDASLVPALDRLLPHFTRLTNLVVSATEISNRLFPLLPMCLRHLEIRSFGPRSLFCFDDCLLDSLEDEALDIRLETLVVRDVLSEWDEDELEELSDACLARGVRFSFLPDAPLVVEE